MLIFYPLGAPFLEKGCDFNKLESTLYDDACLVILQIVAL